LSKKDTGTRESWGKESRSGFKNNKPRPRTGCPAGDHWCVFGSMPEGCPCDLCARMYTHAPRAYYGCGILSALRNKHPYGALIQLPGPCSSLAPGLCACTSLSGFGCLLFQAAGTGMGMLASALNAMREKPCRKKENSPNFWQKLYGTESRVSSGSPKNRWHYQLYQ